MKYDDVCTGSHEENRYLVLRVMNVPKRKGIMRNTSTIVYGRSPGVSKWKRLRGKREDGEWVQAAYYEKKDCSLHQDKIFYNGRRV